MSSFRLASCGPAGTDTDPHTPPPRLRAPAEPDFGPHVRVFGPETPAAEIRAALDGAPGGLTVLLRPGRYALDVRLGPRSRLAGLGLSPREVTVDGSVHPEGPGGARRVRNLTVEPPGGSRGWAASRAAPLSRLYVRGRSPLPLRRLVTASPGAGAGAGAYTAVLPRPRTGGVAPGAPSAPAVRERPYLHLDPRGRYRVFVPALRRGLPGVSVPVEQFFVARPADPVRTLNRALAQGRHLLLTPGVYRPAGPVEVKWAGSVVLGLGAVTLRPVPGAVAMRVADGRGVRIAGLLFDAPEPGARPLLEFDTGPGRRGGAQEPASVQDVHFRVGGARPGRTGTALVVGGGEVLLDDVRAWRGAPGVPTIPAGTGS
jgi:hypothetical protein